MTVDAVVNAANTALEQGGGVCGAIFSSAGAHELQRACNELAPIKTGEAVITSGFKLPSRFIIHAAGPVYKDGRHGEEALLRACYTNSLKLAVANSCESIAFPLISSGIYGYPKADALRAATSAISDFLAEHDIEVYLVVWDRKSFALSTDLLGEVESYIDEHYVEKHRSAHVTRRDLLEVELEAPEKAVVFLKGAPVLAPHTAAMQSLDDIVGHLDEPFSETLMRLIDAKGKSDAEVYKRANIDRRLFSKIRSNAHYAPSKPTVLAFAVALELSLDQTEDLLERAGFALSHSRKFDVIVEYFISSGKYNVFEINEVLFHYGQVSLG
jgi:O-acetyl-ADP-ribose deacetylase (regulator of RNase III)